MKKIVCALAAVCLMGACQRIEVVDNENTATEQAKDGKKFTFTVKGDFQNPEFGSRANSYMTADGVEMTDLWVIDYKDGEVKQTLHQTKGDSDWGSPTMSLTLGTHHIYFLASRGQGAVYADGIVTWTKPLDTFYLDYEVTVARTSNGNRSVTLNRVATRLNICVEDAIAQGTTALTIAPATWYTGWNMLTGEPVEGSNYSTTIAIDAKYVGGRGIVFSAWGLSGASEWTTDVTITSRAGESVNAQVTIPDAPFMRNRTTIYRGNLYTSNSESSVTLSADWAEAYEGVY